MLEVIEKLLALQERDRALLQLEEELHRIPPEREELQRRTAAAHQSLDTAKHQVKHLESERKKLELEVEQKKQQIERYSLQQYQTKKNEEYRALAHEIELCKRAIGKIEDEELNLMEQGDAAHKHVLAITQEATETQRTVDSRTADLAVRERELQSQLDHLQAGRAELAAAVEPGTLARYERMMKNRGSTVVVGIHRGVCGGCHMQLSRQTVVHCQADKEIVTCSNCGRILYFTRDMDVALVE